MVNGNLARSSIEFTAPVAAPVTREGRRLTLLQNFGQDSQRPPRFFARWSGDMVSSLGRNSTYSLSPNGGALIPEEDLIEGIQPADLVEAGEVGVGRNKRDAVIDRQSREHRIRDQGPASLVLSHQIVENLKIARCR